MFLRGKAREKHAAEHQGVVLAPPPALTTNLTSATFDPKEVVQSVASVLLSHVDPLNAAYCAPVCVCVCSEVSSHTSSDIFAL